LPARSFGSAVAQDPVDTAAILGKGIPRKPVGRDLLEGRAVGRDHRHALGGRVQAGWEAHRKLRNPNVSPQVKVLTCCLAAGVIAVLFRELTYSSLLEHAATAMLFAMSLALMVNGEQS
jgi:hypothetical protein